MIEESIGKRVKAAVSIPADQGWQSHKCELGAGSTIGESVQLCMHQPINPAEFSSLNPGVTLGVSFRVGQRKCMFSSTVQAVEAKGRTLRITVGWPDRVELLQRRAYERVSPPRGRVVAIRFWKEFRDESTESVRTDHYHGQLEDISAGGLRVSAAESIEMIVGHAYRCVFTPEPSAPATVVTAMLRHREPGEPGRVSLGLQFVGLEAYPEGRSQLNELATIVSQYKLARGRRRR